MLALENEVYSLAKLLKLSPNYNQAYLGLITVEERLKNSPAECCPIDGAVDLRQFVSRVY